MTRSWTKAATGVTGKTGSVSRSIKLTRRGTYYFRWSFAGTASYRKAASPVTKVTVK